MGQNSSQTIEKPWKRGRRPPSELPLWLRCRAKNHSNLLEKHLWIICSFLKLIWGSQIFRCQKFSKFFVRSIAYCSARPIDIITTRLVLCKRVGCFKLACHLKAQQRDHGYYMDSFSDLTQVHAINSNYMLISGVFIVSNSLVRINTSLQY